MFRRPIAFSLLVASCLVPTAARAADADVRVNSVGYVPGHAKRASVLAPAATPFVVKRDGDGSIALEGTTTGPKTEGGKSVWTADFSKLAGEGKYYVEVAGIGRSTTFAVHRDVYDDTFLALMLGFYGWRCNTEVSFTWQGRTYGHAACHMDDGHTDYLGTVGTRDGKKGWHDAGDYGKYTVNAGVTVGAMLQAWEDFESSLRGFELPIPEKGGALPDYLDEIKYELEWLLTMQYSATDGRVSHKLTSLDFDEFEMPEADLLTRYFVPWGSAATADFVAMLAKASRIYRQAGDTAFADRCLAAARVSYDFLRANPTDVAPDQSEFNTGGYGTSDPDDRLWAAAEMWETTGDAAALTDFETRANAMRVKVDDNFDWGNVKNLGMFVYLRSERSGRNPNLVSTLQKALTDAADRLVAQREASAYGRDIEDYWWGSSGSVARTCMVLQIANRLAPKAEYVDTCVDQVSWLLGRNQYNRSQVTGVGIDPPMFPHHRPSGADGIPDPWPGLLVGGGQSATDWVDEEESFSTNEVAVNWNGAMVYAVASLMRADRYGAGGDAGPGDAGTRGDSTVQDGGRGTSTDASLGTTGSSGRSGSSGQSGRASSGGATGSSSGASDRSGEPPEPSTPAETSQGGCGCRVAQPPLAGGAVPVALALYGLLRRTRRRASRPPSPTGLPRP